MYKACIGRASVEGALVMFQVWLGRGETWPPAARGDFGLEKRIQSVFLRFVRAWNTLIVIWQAEL